MNEDQVLAAWDESLALLDAYESLLSASQKETLSLYFRFNLSLSEIAEEKGISRAAIFDALKKGLAKLKKAEESLHLLAKARRLDEGCAAIAEASSLEEAQQAARALQEEYHGL